MFTFWYTVLLFGFTEYSKEDEKCICLIDLLIFVSKILIHRSRFTNLKPIFGFINLSDDVRRQRLAISCKIS